MNEGELWPLCFGTSLNKRRKEGRKKEDIKKEQRDK